jgi:ribA/ribD-fused uncharacterized protein
MRSAIKTGVVKEFRGDYDFLSNFYTAPFEWRGIEFHSGEQAFAYAKTFVCEPHRQSLFQSNILAASTPGDAKKFGRAVPMTDVSVWDATKIQYMREIVHSKFEQVPGLAGQLLNTGAMMLVEGNTWNDTFWGRCNGKGYNHLGVILMEERGYWLHHEFGE